EGFDFLALRLLPGQGVAAMQPVRVVSTGADPTLPLRMVAAGGGADVKVLLWGISEGRYEASNFSNTEGDFSKLEWPKNATSSNYDVLVNEAMTRNDGRNFTIEYSGKLGATSYPYYPYYGSFQSTYYQAAYASKSCSYQNIHGTDFPSDGGIG